MELVACGPAAVPLERACREWNACSFLADKGYDAKIIYNTVKSVYAGEAFIYAVLWPSEP